MSPYQEAANWINNAPGTGSANSLAKLILSFYNPHDCPYSFGECIGNLDDNLTALALCMAAEYAKHGETVELRHIGGYMVNRYERLWQAGRVMNEARREQYRQWEQEDDEQRAAQYRDGD